MSDQWVHKCGAIFSANAGEVLACPACGEPCFANPAQRSLPADDVLVWATERRHGMRVHDPEAEHIMSDTGGERLLAGDARRAYSASFCYVCWPHPDDVAVRDVAE